mgnify:CR=1 FL=1
MISAIGYRSRPIKGLPFDNQLERIPPQNGLIEPGVYITGWARRGPTGVIPTNRADALEMSKRILSDVESGVLTPKQAPLVSIDTLIAEKGLQVVNYSQWQQLNQAEIAAAMRLIWERLKIIVEPSSAVPLAVILKHPEPFSQQKVGIILTGGNVDVNNLPFTKY